MNRICKLLMGLLVVLTLAGCEYTPVSPAVPDAQPGYAWEYSGRHVIAFTSATCRQCQADKPELRRLAAQGVDVIEVDVDANPELAARYGVEKLPDYLAMEDGEIKARSVTLTVIITFLKVAAWLITMFL